MGFYDDYIASGICDEYGEYMGDGDYDEEYGDGDEDDFFENDWISELNPNKVLGKFGPDEINLLRDGWWSGLCSACDRHCFNNDMKCYCTDCEGYWICGSLSCEIRAKEHNRQTCPGKKQALSSLVFKQTYSLHDEVMITIAPESGWRSWYRAKIISIPNKSKQSSKEVYKCEVLEDFPFLQQNFYRHYPDVKKPKKELKTGEIVEIRLSENSDYSNIRKLDVGINSVKDLIKFIIKWQGDQVEINGIVEEFYGHGYSSYGWIIQEAVLCGNTSVFNKFVRKIDDFYEHFFFIRDEVGRNILQLAIINKQYYFVEMLLQRYISSVRKIVGWIDDRNLHALHYLIIDGNHTLVHKLLYFCCGESVQSYELLSFRSFHFLLPIFAPTNPMVKPVVGMAEKLKRGGLAMILSMYERYFRAAEQISGLVEELQPYPWQIQENSSAAEKKRFKGWSRNNFPLDNNFPLCCLTRQHILALQLSFMERGDIEGLQAFALLISAKMNKRDVKEYLFYGKGCEEDNENDDTLFKYIVPYDATFEAALKEHYPIQSIKSTGVHEYEDMILDRRIVSKHLQTICKRKLQFYIANYQWQVSDWPRCLHLLKRSEAWLKDANDEEDMDMAEMLSTAFPKPDILPTDRQRIVRNIFPAYLQGLISNMEGKYTKEQCKMLEYIANHMSEKFDPLPIVEVDQVHILKYFIKSGLIDSLSSETIVSALTSLGINTFMTHKAVGLLKYAVAMDSIACVQFLYRQVEWKSAADGCYLVFEIAVNHASTLTLTWLSQSSFRLVDSPKLNLEKVVVDAIERKIKVVTVSSLKAMVNVLLHSSSLPWSILTKCAAALKKKVPSHFYKLSLAIWHFVILDTNNYHAKWLACNQDAQQVDIIKEQCVSMYMDRNQNGLTISCFLPMLAQWKASQHREIVMQLFASVASTSEIQQMDSKAGEKKVDHTSYLQAWISIQQLIVMDVSIVISAILRDLLNTYQYQYAILKDIGDLLHLWKSYIQEHQPSSLGCLEIIESELNEAQKCSIVDQELKAYVDEFLVLCQKGAHCDQLTENFKQQLNWYSRDAKREFCDLPFSYHNFKHSFSLPFPIPGEEQNEESLIGSNQSILSYLMLKGDSIDYLTLLVSELGVPLNDVLQTLLTIYKGKHHPYFHYDWLDGLFGSSFSSNYISSQYYPLRARISLICLQSVAYESCSTHCASALDMLDAMYGFKDSPPFDFTYSNIITKKEANVLFKKKEEDENWKLHRWNKLRFDSVETAVDVAKNTCVDSEEGNYIVEVCRYAFFRQDGPVWAVMDTILSDCSAIYLMTAAKKLLHVLLNLTLPRLLQLSPSTDFQKEEHFLRLKRMIWLLAKFEMDVTSWEDEIIERIFPDSHAEITLLHVELMELFFLKFGISLEKAKLYVEAFKPNPKNKTQVAKFKAIKAKLIPMIELQAHINFVLSKASQTMTIFQQALQSNKSISMSTTLHCIVKHGKGFLQLAIENDQTDIVSFLLKHQQMLPLKDQNWEMIVNYCQEYGALYSKKLLRSFKLNRFVNEIIPRKLQQLQQQKLLIRSCIKIQTCVRRYLTMLNHLFDRNAFSNQWKSFRKCWGEVVVWLRYYHKHINNVTPAKTWAQWKRELDFQIASPDDVLQFDKIHGMMKEVAKKSTDAVVTSEDSLSSVSDTMDNNLVLDSDYQEDNSNSATDYYDHVARVDHIELSLSVMKWFEKADATYKELLVHRLNQLAAGERSYALSKRLKHVKYLMYETKLDKGQRILWTKLQRGVEEPIQIFVWFVSKHDHVEHYLRRIEESCERMAKQPKLVCSSKEENSSKPDSLAEDWLLQLDSQQLLIDPLANVPLKTFAAPRTVSKAWSSSLDKPQLLLSSHQQSCLASRENPTESVLLLGRSGTGKTLCLAHAIIEDRKTKQQSVELHQLFVSRSRRLRDFVHNYLLHHDALAEESVAQNYKVSAAIATLPGIDLYTLDSFVNHMEEVVNQDSSKPSRSFHHGKRVDYNRFCAILDGAISATSNKASDRNKKSSSSADLHMNSTILWTQIRSFIKGSVEAILAGRALSLEEYLDRKEFTDERCRLSVEQRKEAYKCYERYDKYCIDNGLWDDADRVMCLLLASQLQPMSAFCQSTPTCDYDRVYVDEIQDSTQAEIMLFLLAAGMNTKALYLAGDPAQSVVEGVDFRFEDVRSIIYKLSQGRQAIQRPLKLHVNYRSHTGILQCAGAVLDRLFTHYPGAAKVLPKDQGMFKGPRPTLTYRFSQTISAGFSSASGTTPQNKNNGLDVLKLILKRHPRLVVICPDSFVDAVEKELREEAGLINLVLGIREAKGLEFDDVVIYDFFSSMNHEQILKEKKGWKLLLDERAEAPTFPAHEYRHFEGQLKLLYTAVTRSCHRLFFIESDRQSAAETWFEWMKKNDLAEMLQVSSMINTEERQDGVEGEDNIANGDILMTNDEWRIRGIEFAMSGDDAEVFTLKERYFVRALTCFERADDKKLQERINLDLGLVRLKIKLFEVNVQTILDSAVQRWSKADEDQMSALMSRCLKGGLIRSSLKLCTLMESMTRDNSSLFREYISKPAQEMLTNSAASNVVW